MQKPRRIPPPAQPGGGTLGGELRFSVGAVEYRLFQQQKKGRWKKPWVFNSWHKKKVVKQHFLGCTVISWLVASTMRLPDTKSFFAPTKLPNFACKIGKHTSIYHLSTFSPPKKLTTNIFPPSSLPFHHIFPHLLHLSFLYHRSTCTDICQQDTSLTSDTWSVMFFWGEPAILGKGQNEEIPLMFQKSG